MIQEYRKKSKYPFSCFRHSPADTLPFSAPFCLLYYEWCIHWYSRNNVLQKIGRNPTVRPVDTPVIQPQDLIVLLQYSLPLTPHPLSTTPSPVATHPSPFPPPPSPLHNVTSPSGTPSSSPPSRYSSSLPSSLYLPVAASLSISCKAVSMMLPNFTCFAMRNGEVVRLRRLYLALDIMAGGKLSPQCLILILCRKFESENKI